MDPNNEKRDREDLRHAVESFVLGVGPRPIWDDFLEAGWERDYNKFKPRSGKRYKYEPLILPEDLKTMQRRTTQRTTTLGMSSTIIVQWSQRNVEWFDEAWDGPLE